jgi:hypothetical protein
MLKSSHQQVDIVSTKNGIRTLIYIVIANSMHVNLLPQSCIIQRFVTSNVTQVKEKSYHDQHPIDQFFPSTIEIFGCLHKQANVFLHNYVNVIWNLKGGEGPPLFILVTFLHKKTQLNYKGCNHPLKLGNNGRPRYLMTRLPSPQPTYYKQSTVEMESF